MDKKPYLKILQYIDNYYYDSSSMNTSDIFYQVFETTIFSTEFLDLDDFVSFHEKTLRYYQYISLEKQYGEVDSTLRDKVIEIIYNIIFYSNSDENIKKKVAGFLARYKMLFVEAESYRKIVTEEVFKLLEGSFGKVFLVDEKFVKKQLKPEYWTDNDISSRFKNEYEVQKRMLELGTNVLEVFDYDDINHSYLMQRADVDLADFLEENIIEFSDKVEMIRQIFQTMRIAHKNGIIHRDLHVGNILLIDKKPYVGDFGFAKDANRLRSKLSTISPKPTHHFVAPEGFRDFTVLNEVSDIFSLGKILDYIMGNGELGTNHPFKIIVEYSTKSLQAERYQDIDLLINAFEEINQSVVNGENIEEINQKILRGEYSISVEKYLMTLVANDKLASQIVANNWDNLVKILKECELSNQERIVNNISQNFAEATGVGGWDNYDLFASLAYEIIIDDFEQMIKRAAQQILEYCADIRFYAQRLLEKIPYNLQSSLG